MAAFTKNVAVTGFTFGLVNRTNGQAVTSGAVTAYVTLDGGTQTAISGTAVHEGNGQWSINLTAAEMNGDIVGLLFTHADAVPKQITIKTTTASAASQASTPGTVSGVTLYAAKADVEFVWSEFGLDIRLDDNLDGVADTGLLNLALQKASLDLNRYLIQRYTVATIAASAWARWATAYLAAEAIGRRRALAIPEGLEEQCKGYREELQRIRESRDHLPSNDGFSTPRFDRRPVMSNLTVDGRYGRSKLRRIGTTSVGPNQADGLERNDELYPYGY